MTCDVVIHKLNELYIYIEAKQEILNELWEYYGVYSKNYQYDIRFKHNKWDGKIRLFKKNDNLLYYGLLRHLILYIKSKNYTYKIDFDINEHKINYDINFYLKYNLNFIPYDHQLKTIEYSCRYNIRLFLSATNSGKTLTSYLLTRNHNVKTLIIVPRIQLVTQLVKDWKSYGYDTDANMQFIFAGKAKDGDKQVTVATYHSIHKLPLQWFKQFDMVIGDEVHTFTANSLKNIMNKCLTVKYRYGFTGSFEDSKTAEIILKSYFGEVSEIITAKELIDTGKAAKINPIYIIIFDYPKQIKQELFELKKLEKNKLKKLKLEYNFITQNEKRNTYITNIACKLSTNSLLLFSEIEHGKILQSLLSSNIDYNKKFNIIYGSVHVTIRDQILDEFRNSTSYDLIASLGTFSTGISVNNIYNILFTSPFKAKIKTLQSIGRGLRKHPDKTLTIIDFVDDLSIGNQKNFTYKHMNIKIQYYLSEGYDIKYKRVKLYET